MAPIGEERFCDSCRKAVHDFSSLTRRAAEALVRRNPTGLCARIAYDSTGTIVFRRDPSANAATRLVGLSLLGASALAAQTPTSSGSCRLDVKVTDVTGAVVPGAAVELTSGSAPQEPLHAKTGTDGSVSLDVPAGQHTLKVESPGFATKTVAMSCDKAVPLRADVQLQLGVMVGEVITVDDMSFPRRAWYRMKSLFARAF
jgi:hypothetical protein